MTVIRDGIEFDSVKNDANREKHGMGLDEFHGFDSPPIEVADNRRDYGEQRISAFGMIDGKPYNLVYTVRGDRLRLISFRRAHREELGRYAR